MSVLFIHPPLQTKVSGGNVYNRHILLQALENAYPLVSLPVKKREVRCALSSHIARLKPRLLIWDSLFFELIPNHTEPSSKITAALLMHYLPSQNPSLDRASGTELRQLEDTAIRNCERVICTGSATFRTLAERHPDKPLFLCRPGVGQYFHPAAEDAFKPGRKERVDLISVANLLPDKGYRELLEALSNLQTQPWTWHIVGSEGADLSFSGWFRATALAKNLLSRICFHGVLFSERLAILLSKMDLFVNASRYESYGMALAEAVAAGLPAVSTRTGDASEMILDGHSGFLVPIADRSALQSALEELIRNPDLLHRFRENSRARPRRSWRSCFENFKEACDFLP
ncbi:MAG: glycosyltransferase family 4 protein [Methylococcaceae bacterium]|nr:glycosyltransferase family 4 protein [Methylococcaceae bacterium]MCI0667327.1 glycosyltransferase family 4 protein [Methylococcaceae bacterium]MCI0734088.1 glycosyltransferase family 4 protein [Methylococcaceae bacterium]